MADRRGSSMSPELKTYAQGGVVQQYHQQRASNAAALPSQQQIYGSTMKGYYIGKDFNLSQADYELFDALQMQHPHAGMPNVPGVPAVNPHSMP